MRSSVNKPFITVIGNIASGKSTTARFIAENLPARFVPADELYKENPFFEKTVKDRKRWSLTSDMWFLIKRAEVVDKISLEVKEKAIVQDSGIPMSWVYANSRIKSGYMKRDEFNLYNSLFTKLTNNLPKEDLIIYLNVKTSVLLDRIKKRSRSFEIENYTPEYIAGLSESLEEYVLRLKKDRKVLTLGESNWCDIIKNQKDRDRLMQMIKKEID